MNESKCFLCGRDVKIEEDTPNRNKKVYCKYCTPDWYEITDRAYRYYFKRGVLTDNVKDKLIKEIAKKPHVIDTKVIKTILNQIKKGGRKNGTGEKRII